MYGQLAPIDALLRDGVGQQRLGQAAVLGVGEHLAGHVDAGHLQAYLDEFVFRFNRRSSRSRGLVFHRVLGLGVGHEPVRYRDLVVDPRPKRNPPAGRAGWGDPPSLERPAANRPWRVADQHGYG